MNIRTSLIALIEAQALSNPNTELVVSLESFFEGNDDLGSIGCNLGDEQPSPSDFYQVLSAIRSKSEVQDVLVRICDYSDPDSWPYTDTVYIVTSASAENIEEWLGPLKPDEVHPEWMYGKPPAAPEPHPGMTAYSVWWD